MSPETLRGVAPVVVLVVCAAGVVAPLLMRQLTNAAVTTCGVLLLLAVGLLTRDGSVAYGACALTALVHAFAAWPWSRTGAVGLAVAGGLSAVASVALVTEQPVVALVASLATIALRAGTMPVHVGVASLTDRAPALQAQQLASTIALVFVHLRYVDHHPVAFAIAPAIVRIGAAATLLPALFALVQRDLRGLLRNAVVMHGGMLFAAVGAAGHGHYAAALFLAITLGIAVGGFLLVAHAVEQRAGRVLFTTFGGRARAFPALTAAFALLGGAGVAMPGTAGFIADDLFLHALWEESVFGTAAVIFGSASLAIATLVAFGRVFLGPQRTSLAPDLLGHERAVVVLLLVVLLSLGIAPELILEPAEALLGS